MGRRLNKQQKLVLTEQALALRLKGKTMHTIATELGLSSQTVFQMLSLQASEVAEAIKERVEALKAEQTEQLDYILEEALDAWERSKADAEKTRTKRLGAKQDDGATAHQDAGTGLTTPGTGADPADLLDGFDPESIPFLYLDEDGEEVSPEERAQKIAAAALAYAQERAKERAGMAVVEQVDEVKGQVGDTRYLSAAMNALEAKRRIWGLDAPKADAPAASVVVKVYEGVNVAEEV